MHSVNIYPICDLPLYRSARRSFAPSQKSRRHNRSSKLFEVVKRHLPDVHAHAGDDELYISFKPGSSASELEAITASQDCILDITDLHNVGRIKRFLSFEGRKLIVQAIVMSRIDYCNSLLYGVAATSLSKLQRVQNAAVRLVRLLPRHEHVTSSFTCIRLH